MSEFYKSNSEKPVDSAAKLDEVLKVNEKVDKKFVEECDKYLLTMEVQKGPVSFKFPYIENGSVKLADGVMEQEKMLIGGHEYKIKAPMAIILTKIEFPGGYHGTAKMFGSMFGVDSPVSANVETAELYTFLNVLRTGLPAGTVKKLQTIFGKIDFTAS